jgi:hypothetical protein
VRSKDLGFSNCKTIPDGAVDTGGRFKNKILEESIATYKILLKKKYVL